MQPPSTDFTLSSFIKETILFYHKVVSFVIQGAGKYWIFSVLILILVSVSFYYQSTQIHSYFKGETSYVRNYLPQKVYGDKLKGLQQMVVQQDFRGVAHTLDLPLELSQSLLFVEAKSIAGTLLHEDYEERNFPFFIEIELNDIENVEIIQNSITPFLRKGNYVNQNINQTKREISEQIRFLEKDIAEIDSMKLSLPTERTNEIISLFELARQRQVEITQLESKLKLDYAVDVLSPLNPVKIDKQEKLIRLMLSHLLLWLIISFVITTTLHWFNKKNK